MTSYGYRTDPIVLLIQAISLLALFISYLLSEKIRPGHNREKYPFIEKVALFNIVIFGVVVAIGLNWYLYDIGVLVNYEWSNFGTTTQRPSIFSWLLFLMPFVIYMLVLSWGKRAIKENGSGWMI